MLRHVGLEKQICECKSKIDESDFLWYNLNRICVILQNVEISAKKTYISIIIWREKMRISYRPLWVMLAEREISKKQLRELSGISTASLAKLGKGENLTTDTLLKICKALNCSITEIMETVPDVRQNEDLCEE